MMISQTSPEPWISVTESRRLADLVEGTTSRPGVVVCFDAFVDENVRLVKERHPDSDCELIHSIDAFGDWVKAAAGRSGMREYVLEEQAAGGCALNMGDGLSAMGFPVDAFIGIGDDPHPVFRECCARFRSVDALGMGPGRSFVLQFDDGKLILARFENLLEVSPERLRESIQGSAYKKCCAEAGAVAFMSWASYSRMTDCWRMLQSEVLADLPNRPILFFDLADPVNRSQSEISRMLECLRDWELVGPVILSVNENEAEQLATVRGAPEIPGMDLPTRAARLRELLGISELVIHSVRSAAAADTANRSECPGPFCAKPLKTVGAGDRFNAGYLAGRVSGWDIETSLALGNIASGFFVRNARSATVRELASLLKKPRP